MARWFRFYSEALNDPKVQKLDGDTFKAWVNLLCLAAENDGYLPDMDSIAFALRMDNIAAVSLIDRLRIAGLIDTVKGGPNGSRIAPHGWNKRQYKSDSSSERVKRYRQRSKTVSETPPDTDTETDSSLDKSKGASASSDRAFWATGKAYLAEHGVRNPGALIGKWCKQYGQSETAKAITTAQLERVVEPISYIERVLRRGGDEASKYGDVW